MKKQKIIQVLSYIGTLVLMYCCSLFCIAFYRVGVIVPFLLMIIMALKIGFLCYCVSYSLWGLVFLYFNLVISAFFQNYMSTMLYYKNISSDPMTLVVGRFMLIPLFFVIGIASGIAIFIKYYKQKKKENSADI